MKKFFVKWAMVDEYGYAEDYCFNWFETKEEAEAFVADKKARNGGYFKAKKIAEGNYDNFQKMEAMKAEIEKLEQEF